MHAPPGRHTDPVSAEPKRGVVAKWNDDRGFGFIAPSTGGPDVFAHVSAFPRGRRPSTGCEVVYAEVLDERNRPCASDVRYVSAVPPLSTATSTGTTWAGAMVALFFAVLVGLVAMDQLPVLLLAAYGLLSAAAFGMYRRDKSAALRGRWRTSEASLHAIALAGGWPGALIAQQVYRHKTTKQPFRTVFWVTVLVNCLALAWLVYSTPL